MTSFPRRRHSATRSSIGTFDRNEPMMLPRGASWLAVFRAASVPEACRFLSVHRNTLYKLIRAGELPGFRLITGGHWRFRKTDLSEWLETRRARSSV